MPGGFFSPANRTTQLLDSADQIRKTASVPVPAPRELDKTVLAAYVLEPGDALLIQPADPDSNIHIPADQPILPDGTINLGRYGRLVVAGRTVEKIEQMIQATIAAQTKSAGPIVVRIATRQSKIYYVLGAVNSPGAFPLAGRETVLDAILAAGGLTERASRERIILSRPTPPDSCRIVLPVCYRQIVQLGDTSTNYQVLPGDRIYVPSRNFCEGFGHKRCGVCRGPQCPCSDAEATGTVAVLGQPEKLAVLSAVAPAAAQATNETLGMPRALDGK
jgi:protein involved in polysaccharide export with SLBB domain